MLTANVPTKSSASAKVRDRRPIQKFPLRTKPKPSGNANVNANAKSVVTATVTDKLKANSSARASASGRKKVDFEDFGVDGAARVKVPSGSAVAFNGLSILPQTPNLNDATYRAVSRTLQILDDTTAVENVQPAFFDGAGSRAEQKLDLELNPEPDGAPAEMKHRQASARNPTKKSKSIRSNSQKLSVKVNKTPTTRPQKSKPSTPVPEQNEGKIVARAAAGARRVQVQSTGQSKAESEPPTAYSVDVHDESASPAFVTARRTMALAKANYLKAAAKAKATSSKTKTVTVTLQFKSKKSACQPIPIPKPKVGGNLPLQARSHRPPSGSRPHTTTTRMRTPEDKYFVPTPYRFRSNPSASTTEAQRRAHTRARSPTPVTIDYKNPNASLLSTRISEMETALASEFDIGDTPTLTAGSCSLQTLDSSTASVIKAQEAREEAAAKAKSAKSKKATTKSKATHAPVPAKTKISEAQARTPKLKPLPLPTPTPKPKPKQITPFCVTCKKNPTILAAAGGPESMSMSQFTATLERLHTKIMDVKLREAAVTELDERLEARAAELKNLQAEAFGNAGAVRVRVSARAKEVLLAQISETKAALKTFVALESGAHGRVRERLRLQPVAVLEELPGSEQLQGNVYLEETLVLFFELLKLCEGSINEDWFDAAFVAEVGKLDAELRRRFGLAEASETFPAGAHEARGCHSAVPVKGEPPTSTEPDAWFFNEEVQPSARAPKSNLKPRSSSQ